MTGDSKLTPIIVISKKGAVDRTVPLDRSIVGIGRNHDCDIVLPDLVVSGEHARIERRGDGYYLEDLGSHNGTRVGGRSLAPRFPLRLHDGQKLQICGFTLLFCDPVVPIRETDKDDSSICGTIDVASSDLNPRSLAVRPEEKLRAVLEVGRCLGMTLDLGEIFDKALQSLFTIFPQADRGFVLLKDRDGTADTLQLRASRSRRPASEPYTLSSTVLDLVLGQGLAIHCDDTRTDHRFDQANSVMEDGIRALLCVPILDQKRPVGLLQIDARNPLYRFNNEDLDVLVAVVGQLGVARRAALLHEAQVRQEKHETELRSAREVQRSLLPARPPRVDGYEFWGRYEPARQVGGDYVGYFPVANPGRSSPRWAVAVGDVSGKGMPAALLMAKLSAEVSVALAAEPDPGRAVTRLNRRFCEANLQDDFITFLLVILEADTGRLSLVRAGHCLPLVRRADGRVETIGEEPSGPPLGIHAWQVFEAAEAVIGPGEVVVLYTDGISEAFAPGGQAFGTDRISSTIADAPAGVAAIGEAILQAVERHIAGAPPSDDIALIGFGRVSDEPAKDSRT
ncbi:SpoIIE family protein phosphatase [soil metagenome]